MRLILQRDSKPDANAASVRLFEKVILEDPRITPMEDSWVSDTWFKIRRRIDKVLGADPYPSTPARFLIDPLNDPKSMFAVLMGVDFVKYKPYAHRTSHARAVYLYDAWPKDYHRVLRLVNEFKVDIVFVSSSISAERLNERLGRRVFHFIPEGVEPSAYRFVDYDSKDIDLLAMGRRYDSYHEAILPSMEANRRKYLYEVSRGALVFPKREDMVDGLARAKISVCVPKSISHPESAGDCETMTMRYLESMASKCLIIGHSPKELDRVFGYSPVIEIDWNDPQGQIEGMLRDYKSYIPLIERNYEETLSRHTYRHRFQQMKAILSNGTDANVAS